MAELTAPLRILHVFGRMRHGGAQLRTIDVMRALDRERYHLDYCSLDGLEGVLAGPVRELGGTVFPIKLDLRFPGRFHALLRSGRYDVVHSHVHHSSGLIVRLAARAGVPVRITHFRNTDDGRAVTLRRRLQTWLLKRWIDLYSTDILAVSEGAMRVAWGPAWSRDPRCRVIYNGLDPALFAAAPDPIGVRREFGIADGRPLFINVARLVKQKNHLRLLDMFGEVLEREPSACLLLVGRNDGAIGDRVRARIAERGWEETVVMAGLRSDIPRLLGAAAAMIFPSLWEGLPGVVLESCAAGTPVLASDLPGCVEIAAVFPWVRCLPLVTDDAHWAQAAVDMLAEQPGACRTRRQHAFAESRFHIDLCVAEMAQVWDRARGGRPAVARPAARAAMATASAGGVEAP